VNSSGAGDLFGAREGRQPALGAGRHHADLRWPRGLPQPGGESRASALFSVKNHPFVDGNKRIAAALFLWFLEKNRALYRPDGGKRIADNALVAMTLLIAESRPREKDILARVVVNLINRRNP